jgi:hypothetical protein
MTTQHEAELRKLTEEHGEKVIKSFDDGLQKVEEAAHALMRELMAKGINNKAEIAEATFDELDKRGLLTPECFKAMWPLYLDSIIEKKREEILDRIKRRRAA